MLKTFNYYNFTFNDKAGKEIAGKQSAGLIAQQIKPVFNFAVYENKRINAPDGEDPYMTVKYYKFIPVAINAIKELSTKVKELSAQLNNRQNNG